MNLRLIARLKAAWAAFCVDPRTVFTVTMPKAASLPVFPPEPPPPPTVIAVQRIHQQLKTDERGVTMEYGVNIALHAGDRLCYIEVAVDGTETRNEWIPAGSEFQVMPRFTTTFGSDFLRADVLEAMAQKAPMAH